MAGFITAEGLVVAAGGDAYDYVNDQRRLAGSIRSVVPAADHTAGDTIASAMNTDGRPVSATNPLVIFNQATRTVDVKDNVGWVPSPPFAVCAGFASIGAVPANSTTAALNQTFPAGKFTQPPVLVLTTTETRLQPAFANVTTTGFQLYLQNNTSGASSGSGTVTWHAIQMTPAAAAG